MNANRIGAAAAAGLITLGAAACGASNAPTTAASAPAWGTAMAYFVKAGKLVMGSRGATVVPAAVQNAKSGFAALATVAGEIDKYTPAQP